jgi:carboxylesterase type B
MQINNQPGPVDCTKYLRDLFKYCAFASGTKEFVDRMIVAENSPDSTLQPKKHFMYNFDYFYWYPSPYYQNTFNDGATHTSELPFVFGTELEGAKLEDIHMSRSMMTY